MIDSEIKKFLLRALLIKGDEPMSAVAMKAAARGAFSATLTEGDLNTYITQLEDDNLIAGTSDGFDGTLWALTPKGRIRVQQLNRK